jgi:hypothetical protein
MSGMTQLATTFCTTEWDDLVMLTVPAAAILLVTAVYLASRNRVLAGLHYLMLSAIVLINLRLLAAGQWTATFVPRYDDGGPFVPDSRLRIWFFGTLALDVAMLLAAASLLIAPHSRRLVRRILGRHAAKRPAPAEPSCPVERRPGGFLRHPAVRKSCFPLTVLAVWLMLMFGGSQWCRVIYMYQAYVYPGEEPRPPSDYTGPWKTYSGFGTLLADGWFKDGRRHGTWQINALHQKRTENYKDGELDGRYVIWNGRGIKEMEYHYKEGLTDGLCTDWWSEGTKLQEFTDRRGVHQGRYREWHYDGQLMTDCIYRDGKVWNGMYGKSDLDHYENYGTAVFVQDTYRDGVKDGPAKVWVHEYGEPEEVLANGTRKNGQPWDGTVLTFVHLAAGECRYWVRTYKQGKVGGPARLYAARARYSQEQDGIRVALGPTTHDMLVIAEGDLEEITLAGGSLRVVPKGLWRFRDQRTPTTVLEGTYRNGEPWSGTFPRHGGHGNILDQCTFEKGKPQDGTRYVTAGPESRQVLKYTYERGKVVGPPTVCPAADTPLPLSLRD